MPAVVLRPEIFPANRRSILSKSLVFTIPRWFPRTAPRDCSIGIRPLIENFDKTDGTVLTSLRICERGRAGNGNPRVGGNGGAGFRVRAADAAAEPRVCGRGGADAGAGDWGEYRDFYAAGPNSVAVASGEESAAAGAADHARQALREQLGRQRNFLPDVPGLSRSQPSVFRNVLPVSAAGEHDVWRAVGACGGGAGFGDVLRGAGSGNGAGARVHAGR